MNNEKKKNFFSKVFGYQKHEYKATRHLSIDCSSEEPPLRFIDQDASQPLQNKISRKFSVPLLRRLSMQNESPMKAFKLKTKKPMFLEDVDEEDDDEKKKKERKKEAKILKRKKNTRKDSSPLQCRIISPTTSLADGALDYPATPEMMLEHHRRAAFLTPNEEWVLIELNEYECLVESLEMVKVVAKHSQFFEVEPEQLWEEFFEFVAEASSYDDVLNEDIWQEFRDKKYVC